MFLVGPVLIPAFPSFPRARGDVPRMTRPSGVFSAVFPAHAGMFRQEKNNGDSYYSFPRARGDVPVYSRAHAARFPRARGDVPTSSSLRVMIVMFSPRTRGCSIIGRNRCGLVVVFPAHAGMFRSYPTKPHGHHSFPRARGDVPPLAADHLNFHGFSPRTRGCSRAGQHSTVQKNVFPAHAGMFRVSG